MPKALLQQTNLFSAGVPVYARYDIYLHEPIILTRIAVVNQLY